MEPEVLLLDEPLSNLDAKLRESIRAELRRMQKALRITTIYVTHDQTEALSMSDQVVVMNRGMVIQVGSPRDVYFSPLNRFVASFVGMANLLEARVVEAGASGVTCDAGGFRLRVAPSVVGLQRGSRVALSVRPEHLRLWSAAPGSSETNVIAAVVLSSLFEGSRMRYWVRSDTQELVVDEFRRGVPLEAGAAVHLSVAPEDIHLMRENADA